MLRSEPSKSTTPMIEHGKAALARANEVLDELLGGAEDVAPRAIRIVNAPAGAGKTGLVTRLIPRHVKAGRRVAVTAQTNEQADDLTRRLASEQPALQILRLVSSARKPTNPPANVTVVTDATVSHSANIVIATADKWAYSVEKLGSHTFDVGIIDEAYQMSGGKLLYIGDLFGCLELVGDPGQLSPFSQVDTGRWVGLAEDPTKNAVDTIRHYHDVTPATLPVTRRLPAVAADIVRTAFYPDLAFGAATEHGARLLRADPVRTPGTIDGAVDAAFAGGWSLATLPRRSVLRNDRELADAAAAVARNVLERNTVRIEDEHTGLAKTITADRIAIGASHRDQVAAVNRALSRLGVTGVVVDTANRLQGREYDVVIAWHPLSGQAEVGAFHLDVGRMCVLTTRHRHACIVIARDGIGELLDASVPVGEGILGDVVDRSISGWEAHLLMLDHLEQNRVPL